MSTKAVSNFVDTVIQHFPPFRWDDEQEKAWVKTMVQELSSFSDDVLNRTVSEMVRTRKDRRIPLVAECVTACVETRRWMDMETNQERLPEFRSVADEWSTERCRLAHEMKRTELGRRAAHEGWIVAFWHFCRRNQRLPAGAEIDQCKRDSEGVEDLYREAMQGKRGPLSAVIAKLGASILDKRMKWTEEALGR